jgi:hypothetical protein
VRLDDGAFATGAMRFGTRVVPKMESLYVAVEVAFLVEHPALALPCLEETFGGARGGWDASLAEALARFEHGMLPVLVAGLLDRQAGADEVRWEPLGDEQGRFELCVGAELREPGTEPEPSLRSFLDELKAALADELAEKAHWLRVEVYGEHMWLRGCRVELDNQPWEEGERLAKRRRWGGHRAAWGRTCFALVVPKRAAGEAGEVGAAGAGEAGEIGEA